MCTGGVYSAPVGGWGLCTVRAVHSDGSRYSPDPPRVVRTSGARWCTGSRLAGGGLDPAGQLAHLVEDGAALGEQLVDLAVGVHHRRVVTVAELRPDLGQGEAGELAAQVHRDLARHDEVATPAGSGELLDGDAEVGRGLGDDEAGGDLRLPTF